MTTADTTGTLSRPPKIEPGPRAIAVAKAVLERENPDFAILFGSRARGDWTEDSDIDLMLVTSRVPGEDSDEHCMAEPDYRSLRPGTAATVRAEQRTRMDNAGRVPRQPGLP